MVDYDGWDGLVYGLQLLRLVWSVLTSPCGCEPSASHIEGDPISVCPGMKLMRTLEVIWWICRTLLNYDILRQLKTDLKKRESHTKSKLYQTHQQKNLLPIYTRHHHLCARETTWFMFLIIYTRKQSCFMH